MFEKYLDILFTKHTMFIIAFLHWHYMTKIAYFSILLFFELNVRFFKQTMAECTFIQKYLSGAWNLTKVY